MIKSEQKIFSIVMPIYNVETYLREAIDSVINQSFSFEDNVGLILVNDCSTDKCGEICEEYEQKYPHNIKHLKLKTNGGLSNARNAGLEIASGEYINFLDGDDYFQKDVLKNVNKSFQTNIVDVVVLSVRYFERNTGDHPRYSIFEKNSQLVDMDVTPDKFYIAVNSVFYKHRRIKNFKFNPNILVKDFLFNTLFFKKIRRFYFLYEENSIYMYRQRLKSGSLIDKIVEMNNSKWFYDDLKLLCDEIVKFYENYISLPNCVNEMLLYEVAHRFKRPNFPKFEDVDKVYNLYSKILNNCSEKSIITNTNFGLKHKLAMLYIRNEYIGIHNEMVWKNGKQKLVGTSLILQNLGNHPLFLVYAEYCNDGMKVSALLIDAISPNTFLYL